MPAANLKPEFPEGLFKDPMKAQKFLNKDFRAQKDRPLTPNGQKQQKPATPKSGKFSADR